MCARACVSVLFLLFKATFVFWAASQLRDGSQLLSPSGFSLYTFKRQPAARGVNAANASPGCCRRWRRRWWSFGGSVGIPERGTPLSRTPPRSAWVQMEHPVIAGEPPRSAGHPLSLPCLPPLGSQLSPLPVTRRAGAGFEGTAGMSRHTAGLGVPRVPLCLLPAPGCCGRGLHSRATSGCLQMVGVGERAARCLGHAGAVSPGEDARASRQGGQSWGAWGARDADLEETQAQGLHGVGARGSGRAGRGGPLTHEIA